jgi:hypothetical protein
VAGFRAFLGYCRHALSGRNPLLAPTVCITVDDAISSRQHLSKITSPVVRATQRELQLEVELVIVEELPRHLRLLTKTPVWADSCRPAQGCSLTQQAIIIRVMSEGGGCCV